MYHNNIRYTISKFSFSYIMYITIILCRNYLQIVRSYYVYFGQINYHPPPLIPPDNQN